MSCPGCMATRAHSRARVEHAAGCPAGALAAPLEVGRAVEGQEADGRRHLLLKIARDAAQLADELAGLGTDKDLVNALRDVALTATTRANPRDPEEEGAVGARARDVARRRRILAVAPSDLRGLAEKLAADGLSFEEARERLLQERRRRDPDLGSALRGVW